MFFKRVNKWWKGARKKNQGLRTLDDSDFRSNVALFAFAMKICEQQSIGEQIGGNYQDSLALASLPLFYWSTTDEAAAASTKIVAYMLDLSVDQKW